jgi:hypothetical protein
VHLYVRLLSIVLIGARKLIVHWLPARRRVSLTCQCIHLVQNHLEKHFILLNIRIELSIPCFYFFYSTLVLQIFGVKIDLSVFRVTIDGFSKEIRNFTALYSY